MASCLVIALLSCCGTVGGAAGPAEWAQETAREERGRRGQGGGSPAPFFLGQKGGGYRPSAGLTSPRGLLGKSHSFSGGGSLLSFSPRTGAAGPTCLGSLPRLPLWGAGGSSAALGGSPSVRS